MTSTKKIKANRSNANSSTGPKTKRGKAIVATNAVTHGVLSSIAVIPGVEKIEEWKKYLAEILSALSPVGRLEIVLAERLALLSWRMNRVVRYEQAIILALQEKIADDLADEYTFMSKLHCQHPNDVLEIYKQTQYQCYVLENFLSLTKDKLIDNLEAALIVYMGSKIANVTLNTISFPKIPRGTPLENYNCWTKELVLSCIKVISEKANIEPEHLMKNVLDKIQAEDLKAKRDLELVEREMGFMQNMRILTDESSLERIQRYETHLSKQFFQTLHELQRIQAARVGSNVPVPTIVDVNVSSPHI